MKEYLLVFLSVVITMIQFMISKYCQKHISSDKDVVLFNSGFNGLLCAIIIFIISGGKPEITWFSVMMAFFNDLFALLYNIVGFKMMEAGSMALYALFLMSGGMILPYIFGIVALNEAVSVFRILGLLLIIGGVIFANGVKGRMDRRVWKLGIMVFFLNGMVSITSKIHQSVPAFESVSTMHYIFITGMINFIMCSCAWLACRKKAVQKRPMKEHGSVIHLVAISAVIGIVGSFFMLRGAIYLPATVLYPMVTGGVIILNSLGGCIFYKEKLTKQTIIGIVLCFIGTLLFL